VRPLQLSRSRWWGLLTWVALALPAAAQDEPAKTPSSPPDAEQSQPTQQASVATPAAPNEPAKKPSVPPSAESTLLAEGPSPAASPAPSGHAGGEVPMDFMSLVFVFMLATFIGIGVIRRVSRLLHTPLMSLTNAISAISVVGAIIVAGGQHYPTGIQVLGAVALFASMTNIISGFLITDRMLKMFKTREGGKA